MDSILSKKNIQEITLSRRTFAEAFLVWLVAPFPNFMNLTAPSIPVLEFLPFSAPLHTAYGLLSLSINIFTHHESLSGLSDLEFGISTTLFGVACFITTYLVVVALRLLNRKYGLLDSLTGKLFDG